MLSYVAGAIQSSVCAEQLTVGIVKGSPARPLFLKSSRIPVTYPDVMF